MRDLVKLEWLGDTRIEEFYNKWVGILDLLHETTAINSTMLQRILAEKLKSSTVLQQDL